MPNQEKLIQLFELIRDIPYRVPLDPKEESLSCVGKNRRLMSALREVGYDVRWRICTFKWSDLRLSEEVKKVPHDDNATHAYVEVRIGDEWKPIDATWDKGLAEMLPVAEWDDIGGTIICVPVQEVYSSEESERIMTMLDDSSGYRKAFEEDFVVNGAFYAVFNQWLKEVRSNDK